jgi:hypothetical protein
MSFKRKYGRFENLSFVEKLSAMRVTTAKEISYIFNEV